jgi:hypothetical protein
MTNPAAPIEAMAWSGAAESAAAEPGAIPEPDAPLPLLAYTSDTVKRLTDEQLISAQRRIAEHRRLLDASAAVLAAEIDHRSRRELGHSGLAQSRGARNAGELIQHVTGLSSVDARSLVRVGTLMTQHPAAHAAAEQLGSDQPGAASPDGALPDGALPDGVAAATATGQLAAPWLASVAAGVAAGELSIAAAEAIRTGLGQPDDRVGAGALADAATALVREAREVTLERLAANARARRDELDEAGVALREQERRERRFLHVIPRADGMTRIIGLLDPESAAIIGGAIDAITAPRRGGPRFLDAKEAARAAAIENDPRTTPQLALDGLVELVRVATLADRGRVLGARRVGVRVHVAEADLRRGAGAARIEGQTDPVSIATAERIACDNGVLPIAIAFDGRPLDVGRTKRTFTPRQRVALAARDGGCIIGKCEHPPEWCEAHHIDEWMRDGGKTDLADGVLLCRRHHMMLHNLGYRITRTGTQYFLVPPPDAADRTPIALRSNPPVRLRPTG